MDFLANKEPFVVAEISCNHGGSAENAEKLVESAKDAGADAIKIQYYSADEMALPNSYSIKSGPWAGRDLYSLYEKNQTDPFLAGAIFDMASRIGIPAFASVFSPKGVKDLEGLACPAYKVASFELGHIQVLDAIARTGKPVILSTGCAADNEIYFALDRIDKSKTALLHCISGYPTPMNETNLWKINYLKQKFNVPVGFSDHTSPGFIVSGAYAVIAGATILEKHITLDDKTDDGAFSLMPESFRIYTQEAKNAYKSLVTSDAKSELDSFQFKRSIWATKDIKEGDRLTTDNIGIYRPASGEQPSMYNLMLGRKVNEPIKAGEPVGFKHTWR